MLQLRPGAQFRAVVEVKSQSPRQLKLVCPECGAEYGGAPHEYDVQNRRPDQVFECGTCEDEPLELIEHVDVIIRHGKDAVIVETWNTVFDEPVTLDMYRAVYGK